MKKKLLSMVLAALMLAAFIPHFSGVKEANAATDTWDGGVNTDWYTDDPTETSFTINTAEDLAGLAKIVNEGTDDFSGDTVTLNADLDLSGQDWTPIGVSDGISVVEFFLGTFEGNNKTITGLTYSGNTIRNVALFGYTTNDTSGATIQNLGLINVSINNANEHGTTGALVASGYGTTVKNCYATGEVSGRSDVGGLVGVGEDVQITNSYTTVAVSGTGDFVGGLVGNGNLAQITNSYATGGVSGSNAVSGLVGYGEGITITGSYATGGVSGNDNVGGLVGFGEGITITGSYATGGVSGNDNVGGLVGYGHHATITGSYATGTVTGTGNVGGLVGDGNGATINNSYASGEVKADSATDTGGLVGNAGGSSITRSYGNNANTAKGNGSNGAEYVAETAGATLEQMKTDGFVAALNDGGSTFTRTEGFNYGLPYLSGVTPVPTIDEGANRRIVIGDAGTFLLSYGYISGDVTLAVDGTALDSANYTVSESGSKTLVTLNSAYTSGLTDGQSYTLDIVSSRGVLNTTFNISKIAYWEDSVNTDWYKANPTATSFTINTEEELAGLATIVNAGTDDFTGDTVTLANNLDLSGRNWTPIGVSDGISVVEFFLGTFEGNNKTITGLTYSGNTIRNVALFGYTTNDTSGATIQNLGLINVSINNANEYGTTGALVANGHKTTVENCYSTGEVSGRGSEGGLVGNGEGAIIKSSYTTATVSGTGNFVGGLVGYGYEANITTSYATGTVSGSGDVGGLVGYGYEVNITGSYATGAVNGTGNFVGGLVGNGDSAQITNSYATGGVSGSDAVGGLVGAGNGVTIKNSYASGEVKAGSATNTGGLVGTGSANITRSYGNNANPLNGTGAHGTEYVAETAGATLEQMKTDGFVAALNDGLSSNAFARANNFNYDLPYLAAFYTTAPAIESGADQTITQRDTAEFILSFPYVSGEFSVKVGGTALDPSNYTVINYGGKTEITILSDYTKGISGEQSVEFVSNKGGVFTTKLTVNAAEFWEDSADVSWHNTTDTEFIITTEQQLAGLAKIVNAATDDFSGDTVTLANNLDLSGKQWTPIGWYDDPNSTYYAFVGTFEGSGKTVKGLTYDRNTYVDAGLFGSTTDNTLSGTVKNLGIEEYEINNRHSDYYASTGGFVGYADYSNIVNCYAKGNAKGNDYVGGLVGYGDGATITSSYATGMVSGVDNVGGLVGYGNGATITSSYATGTVSGDGYVGGLVGRGKDSTITSSYATGEVSGTSDVGGLVGETNAGTKITNSYGNNATVIVRNGSNGTEYVAGTPGVTLEQMKTADFANKLNEGLSPIAFGWEENYNENLPYLHYFPTIFEGDGATINQGAMFSLRASMPYIEGDSTVLVDSAAVPNATFASGSTIVTLPGEYTSTLALGGHTFEIVSATYGSVSGTFNVVAPGEPIPPTPVPPVEGETVQGGGSADTSDSNAMGILLALMAVGAVGVIAAKKKLAK